MHQTCAPGRAFLNSTLSAGNRQKWPRWPRHGPRDRLLPHHGEKMPVKTRSNLPPPHQEQPGSALSHPQPWNRPPHPSLPGCTCRASGNTGKETVTAAQPLVRRGWRLHAGQETMSSSQGLQSCPSCISTVLTGRLECVASCGQRDATRVHTCTCIACCHSHKKKDE